MPLQVTAAALAVGGSALAQAQVAKTVTQTTVQHRRVESSKPGDPADGQDGERLLAPAGR